MLRHTHRLMSLHTLFKYVSTNQNDLQGQAFVFIQRRDKYMNISALMVKLSILLNIVFWLHLRTFNYIIHVMV